METYALMVLTPCLKRLATPLRVCRSRRRFAQESIDEKQAFWMRKEIYDRFFKMSAEGQDRRGRCRVSGRSVGGRTRVYEVRRLGQRAPPMTLVVSAWKIRVEAA